MATQSNQNQREAVRLLAIQFGVREAARRCGLSEDQVRNWSSRFKWLRQSTPSQLTPPTPVSPGDVLLEELANHEKETRLSLARYSSRAAKDAEQMSVREAPLVHKVAQIAGITYRWSEGKDQAQQFTLNVLNLNMIQDTQE